MPMLREVHNPADGTVVGAVGYGDAADATAAADAAGAAFADWSAMPARARGDVLRACAEQLVRGAEDIGGLLSSETGKRLPEGIAEVRMAAEFFRWYGEQVRRPIGEVIPSELPGRRSVTARRAAGVAVCLTPWNFPVSLQARKLAPALAAGCTTVSRPSEKAPLAVVELFRCLERAGLPAGVANLVHGPAAEVTDALLAHPAVRVVSFTGSTEVGRTIMAGASRRIVRPALELGGDAPFVVCDDADLEAAVDGALIAKFRNNGQSCIAANRFLVQDGIYDAFVGRLAAAVDAMSVGDPLADPVPDLGPLIDDERVAAVERIVQDAEGAGARRLTRERAVPDKGSYVAPALFAGVPDHALLATTEVFGPVAGVFRYRDDEEALARANDTEMGLAAYVYTRDVRRADRFATGLEAGMIGVNLPMPSAPYVPMGGVKQSGLGVEGGREGLEDFEEIRYVAITAGSGR